MEYIDAKGNLKSEDAMGLWVDKSEQVDQSSPDQQKTSVEPTGGHAKQQQRQRGQPRLAEGTERGNSKPDASPSCGPFPHKRLVMDSYSSSHVD